VRQDGFDYSGATFSADTGTLLRQFEADSSKDPAPAFAGRLGFFVHAGVLTARNVETGATIWSFTGEDGFGSSPIVAGSTVYIGSAGGVLYALDRVSGRVLWSAQAGPSFLGSERPMQLMWTGLGAGNGLLVTPAGNRLTAWSPPARGPAEGPAPPPSP
jgi:outer membrane protein assembly factor BamB